MLVGDDDGRFGASVRSPADGRNAVDLITDIACALKDFPRE
jgi:hypothetical protein